MHRTRVRLSRRLSDFAALYFASFLFGTAISESRRRIGYFMGRHAVPSFCSVHSDGRYSGSLVLVSSFVLSFFFLAARFVFFFFFFLGGLTSSPSAFTLSVSVDSSSSLPSTFPSSSSSDDDGKSSVSSSDSTFLLDPEAITGVEKML